MKVTTLLLATCFACLTAAQPTCKNLTIPVTISARNGLFQESLKPTTDVEVTNLFLDLTRPGTNYTAAVLQGYATINGTFNISATYCQPTKGASDVVQILTHGVGFNRAYWDLPFKNYNYSYTNVAVDTYGFATFAYDRLGIGGSQHGDPLNFVQSWTQIAALAALSDMLRNGSVSGIPAFKKVLHVGHSYGSLQAVGVLKMHPQIWDGAALTGYAPNSATFGEFELGSDFIEAHSVASQYPSGYLAPGATPGLQEALLAPDAFDPKILPYLAANGVPPAVGEFLTLTIGNAAEGPPTSFSGPVIVVTGELDLPFCRGNCTQPYNGYPSLPAAAQRLFPKASTYQTVIVPGSGHGLNLQFSNPYTYATVNEFFVSAGLGP